MRRARAALAARPWASIGTGVFLIVAGLASCVDAVEVAPQRTSSAAMEYDERQREVERVQHALEQGDLSSTVLRRYTDGRPDDLRRDLYALYWRLGTGAQERPTRLALVSFLVTRIASETSMLRGQLLKWSQDFRADSFDEEAIAALNALPWTEEDGAQVIRLLGVAEVTSAEPGLKAQVARDPLSDEPAYQTSRTWASLLALARLGDQESLTRVIRRVEGEEDIIVRATILFDDLGYTRQPRAFDALKVYINSDKRLPAIKDGVPGRLEAARAAAVFSKFIENFPIQETDFTEPETYEARVWVNKQTSWKIK